MATVTIYLEQKVVKEDLLQKRSLSDALAKLAGVGSVNIFVLSNNSEETEMMKQAFPHNIMVGSFRDLKRMQNVTKDKVYISDDSEDLLEWSRMCGKAMLVYKHPMKEKDFLIYRFSLSDNTDELLKKIRKFIHI